MSSGGLGGQHPSLPGERVPVCGRALTTSAWLILQRNPLYTAVTQAKRIVVLVGSRRALTRIVRTQGAGRRYTALTQRLWPGSCWHA